MRRREVSEKSGSSGSSIGTNITLLVYFIVVVARMQEPGDRPVDIRICYVQPHTHGLSSRATSGGDWSSYSIVKWLRE